MSKTIEINPIVGTLLLDASGNIVGKYNKETGRGMFAHTFFDDVRTCTIKYSEFYDYENEPFEFDGYWKTDLSCGHTELTIFKPQEGMFCSHCGAKVVSE